jgi:ribose 5-phosphate isomerase B
LQPHGLKKPLAAAVRFWLISSGMFGMLQDEKKTGTLMKCRQRGGIRSMKIAIGSDHGGFDLKTIIIDHLKKQGTEVTDFGTYSCDSCDYPDYAVPVCDAVLTGKADFGILICGTGIGISISANKIHGIRCALLGDVFSAKATRSHNDANVMALGGRVVGDGLALEIVDAFLNTPFSGDQRHAKRIEKMMKLEKR